MVDWNPIYEAALLQAHSRAHPRRVAAIFRFIAKRIRLIAFQAGCEWQVDWGDPARAGKTHPRLEQREWELS